MPGFCRSVGIDEMRENDHLLVPGRYVGAAAIEAVDIAPEVEVLTARLQAHFDEGTELAETILANVSELSA